MIPCSIDDGIDIELRERVLKFAKRRADHSKTLRALMQGLEPEN